MIRSLSKHMTLVKDRLPRKLKVTKDNKNYFLSTENNEYLGHIEYIKKGDVISIVSSHSELKGGFYSIMFTSILSDVREILSDISLSSEALKSYNTLNSEVSNFELAVKIGTSFKPYSREVLLSSRTTKISIKYKHNLSEIFDEYYSRISDKEYTYGKAYDDKPELLEYYLYHAGWDLDKEED